MCNCEICLFLKRTPGESKSIEINKFKKMKNEDINSCIYALIQLSGHSPKTVETIHTNIHASIHFGASEINQKKLHTHTEKYTHLGEKKSYIQPFMQVVIAVLIQCLSTRMQTLTHKDLQVNERNKMSQKCLQPN